MRAVQGYLFAAVAAALAVSMLRTVPQNRSVRRIADLLGGIIVLLVLLRPLIRLRVGDLGDYLARFRPDEAMIDSAVQAGQSESARLISEQTAAYILDKAQDLGARLEVQVELAELSEHYHYPCAVTLRGGWSAEQKRALADYISQTLGIPEERQIWQEE